MADDKLMDAPNQQAVGQPPPWEEGTGGSSKQSKSKDAEEETKPKKKGDKQ